jgi:hypothetical protein
MSGQAAESAKNQILNLSIFVSSLGGGLLLFEDEAGDEFRLWWMRAEYRNRPPYRDRPGRA